MASQTRKDLKLDVFLPYVMSHTAEEISTQLSTIYVDEYGVSNAEWRILANLAQHKTLTAREISELTAMEKSKISRAVSALDKRGLVSQKRAPGDNRAKDLRLTDAGVTLYQSIVPKVLEWERELLNCLDSGEYRDLMYLLNKLKVRLSQ